MKKIILLLAIITAFGCKDETKKTEEVVSPEVVEQQIKLVKNYTPIDMATWTKVRVESNEASDAQFSDVAFHLKRTSTTESAYLASSLIPVKYASVYRASIIVKKGTESNIFGLRISGQYPDRTDAIFNLDNGTVIEYKATRDFENPMATIEKLSDDWYLCTVSTEVAADNARIIIGATSQDKKVSSWEGATKAFTDVYFVPSSIKLEEVIN